RQQLEEAYKSFEESLLSPSPVSIRLNPKKHFELNANPVAWSTAGKYLDKRPVFTLDPAFHAGAYYVQEASSMFLEQVFMQLGLTTKPLCILDLCAAPGGKSTHIISMIHPESLLVSNEVIRSRASILHENMTKWGYDNYIVTNNDPKHFKNIEGFFDVIVVDAPCSGEGLFRKDPDAVTEWSTNNLELCALRQRRILSDVWGSLKKDGILVYCTCTYNPEENEENIKWLQDQHGFESIPLRPDPTWGIEEVNISGLRGCKFFPHNVRGEGFFLTVIRKTEDQHETSKKIKTSTGRAPGKIVEQLKDWIKNPEQITFHQRNDSVYMIKNELVENHSFLQTKLNVFSVGTMVSKQKADKLIPEHSLAVSVNLNVKNFPSIELSLDDALLFLRKDNIALSEYKKGHTLVTYKSLPIGWLNVLENRANNLYPKEWRIRMRTN
ncbi:MAG: rRNA methyltransferase, partial [Cyclobacteriaceae bacterium]|nr:rRNA methyltransferase [Cyclobacteriaceae bacterium]